MLKRKMYQNLLDWKRNPEKHCLMLKGARQVGKTYLVREFGKNEYKSFIEINFIKNSSLKAIFDGDLSAHEIYKKLSGALNGIALIPGNTLIFLDEIQNCGNARTAIKFLDEDGSFDIISSGSLLGLSYAEEGDEDVEEPTSVPTGYEDFLTMYSLDFEEFLWAEGYGDDSVKVLKEYYDTRGAVPEVINDKYEQLFREYMVVGGMPEVVSDYAKTHDFNRVAKIQNRILEDYRFDISKHAKGSEKIKVRQCFDSVPMQLAKEIKKFQYSVIEKGQTKKKYGGSVKWLSDSAIVNVCNKVLHSEIPLMANADTDWFKLYIHDTGILSAMYGHDTKLSILNNSIKGNAKGGIYENAIAEALVKNGYKLYFYKPDDSHELEFIIEKDGEVIPIEVKAGNTATVSMNTYIDEYKPSVAYKYINGNVGFVDNKYSLPHYMVMFI